MKKGNVILLSVSSLLALVFIVSLVSAADPVIPGTTADPNSIPGATTGEPANYVTDPSATVAVTPVASKTIMGKFTGFFKSDSVSSYYKDWVAGKTNRDIAKILLFILLTFILFAVFGMVFTGGYKWLGFLAAGIISFLAFTWVKPEQINAILYSYDTLGLTLTAIIPMAFLILLTYRTGISNQPGLYVTQKFIWILFLCFTVYKALFNVEVSADPSVVAIIAVVTVIAAVFVIFNEWIVTWIAGEQANDRRQRIARKFDLANMFIDNAARAGAAAAA